MPPLRIFVHALDVIQKGRKAPDPKSSKQIKEIKIVKELQV